MSSTDGCWAEIEIGRAFQTTGAVTWKLRWSSSGPLHNHISMLSWTQVWPDRDVDHWNAVPEICWTRAADRVKSIVLPWTVFIEAQTEDVMQDWSDVVILVKLAGTNNQMGSGVKHHLQVAVFWLVSVCRIRTVLIVVNPGRKIAALVRRASVVTSKLLELVEAAADNVPDMLSIHPLIRFLGPLRSIFYSRSACMLW